ncbi:MAG: hypothetical protein SFY69_02305 [Planctomycetota bacterium]|nr:hypothetical protein [Planctomycetota bacterium]
MTARRPVAPRAPLLFPSCLLGAACLTGVLLGGCAGASSGRPPLWTEVLRDEVSPDARRAEAERFGQMWGHHLSNTTPSYDPVPGRSLPRSPWPGR